MTLIQSYLNALPPALSAKGQFGTDMGEQAESAVNPRQPRLAIAHTIFFQSSNLVPQSA
jgi:hypothetical protein